MRYKLIICVCNHPEWTIALHLLYLPQLDDEELEGVLLFYILPSTCVMRADGFCGFSFQQQTYDDHVEFTR